MDESRRCLVRAWLVKARSDLVSARKLAAGSEPCLDTAIFHCQQAAEKAVKGFLVYHDQKIVKTHDVRFLCDHALPFEEGFSAWLAAADCITPYATLYRYPDEDLEPDQEEFNEALTAAEGIFDFVLSVLPEQVRPGEVDSPAEEEPEPGPAEPPAADFKRRR